MSDYITWLFGGVLLSGWAAIVFVAIHKIFVSYVKELVWKAFEEQRKIWDGVYRK